MKKEYNLSIVGSKTEKEWMDELNKLNQAFFVHEITLEDQERFLKEGFYCGDYHSESLYFSRAETFRDSKLGKTKCFLVESLSLTEIVCGFCIKACELDGDIFVEIQHLAKECKYENLVKLLGHKHYGKSVLERFAIPLAKLYCRELRGTLIFARVPTKLVPHLKSPIFKVASKGLSSKLSEMLELHEDENQGTFMICSPF